MAGWLFLRNSLTLPDIQQFSAVQFSAVPHPPNENRLSILEKMRAMSIQRNGSLTGANFYIMIWEKSVDVKLFSLDKMERKHWGKWKCVVRGDHTTKANGGNQQARDWSQRQSDRLWTGFDAGSGEPVEDCRQWRGSQLIYDEADQERRLRKRELKKESTGK